MEVFSPLLCLIASSSAPVRLMVHCCDLIHTFNHLLTHLFLSEQQLCLPPFCLLCRSSDIFLIIIILFYFSLEYVLNLNCVLAHATYKSSIRCRMWHVMLACLHVSSAPAATCMRKWMDAGGRANWFNMHCPCGGDATHRFTLVITFTGSSGSTAAAAAARTHGGLRPMLTICEC